MSRTRNIASLPCEIVLGDLTQLLKSFFSSGVFRRETASGFYPWGKVEVPCKRVAVGLCGWRHGNSFPMTQSARSLRQMRSIPRCPKAVFYVFFDSIHDSATMHNLSPEIFHWTKFMSKIFFIIKKMRFFYIFCRFCWIFSFSCVYLRYLFKVNQPANVPTWCHIEGGYRRWKKGYRKNKGILLIARTLSLKTPFWLCQNDAITLL